MEKIGDRKKKHVLDLSPFFLYEAAGDSECDLDYHHNMMMVMGMGMGMGMGSSCHDENEEEGDDDDDDALSCSYDVWDDNNILSSHTHINESRNDLCRSSGTHKVRTIGAHHHSHVNVKDDDYGDSELVIKGSKEGIMYSSKISYSSREDYKCTSEVMSTANSRNSSRKSCIDSIEGKNLSEKERSRLFWETCLAS
ncbi:hypothetical protein SOVF_114540 [Spinacia oleracea]|nr:hypothetical protein SOVF_114540 [Spinacia oleracea]